MKHLLHILGAGLICASTSAQEPTPGNTPAEAPAVQEAMPVTARDGLGQVVPAKIERASTEARRWLKEKGFDRTGYFEDKDAFFAIGEATILVGPDDALFGTAREIAYEQALLKCKENLATFIAAEIDTRIKSIIVKPNRTKTVSDSRARLEALLKAEQGADGATKGDLRSMSMIDKATLLATSELDKVLTDRGHIDPSDPEKEVSKKEMADAITALTNPVIVAESSYLSIKGLTARTEAAGMRSLVTFEAIPKGKRGSIAVIGYISKSSKAMAKPMLGKGDGIIRADKKSEPIGTWVTALDGNTLLFSHGVLQRYDENGQLWLVAFGQSTPEFDDEDMADIARDEASLNALAALRSYAGESVIMEKRKSTSLDTKTFVEADRQTSREFTNSSSYKKTTSAIAEPLRLPGATIIRSWETVHPLTRAQGFEIATCGVVYGWNTSSAEAAMELGNLLESIGGSRGGTGHEVAGEPIPGGKGKGAGGEIDSKGGSGKGAEGEIDD